MLSLDLMKVELLDLRYRLFVCRQVLQRAPFGRGTDREICNSPGSLCSCVDPPSER